MQIWEIGTIKVIELWYIYLIEIKIAINAKINSILLQKIHVHKMAKKCVFYSSKLDQNIYGELMLHIDIKELLLRALNFFLCSAFKFQCTNYDLNLSFLAKIRLKCLKETPNIIKYINSQYQKSFRNSFISQTYKL